MRFNRPGYLYGYWNGQDNMSISSGELTMKKRYARPELRLLALLAVALHALAGCGSGISSGGVLTQPHTLTVVDSSNNRVLIFDSPFSGGESATTVLGQAGFTTSASATTASGLMVPVSTAMDAQGNIWVSDVGNNRVLRYATPFTDGEAANLVLGQANFTTGDKAISLSGMSLPHDLAFDKNGNLWVADSYNSRILEFAPPFSSGMAAILALGQPGFTNGACNGNVSAASLCFPTGVTFDADGDLWVADNNENRVVEFKPPFVNGESASIEIGQQDFASRVQGTGAGGLSIPFSAAFDKTGNLWVTDSGNWRVLEFSAPFFNGQAASFVLGYPNFTTTVNNNLQSNMTNPWALAFDDAGDLFVADVGGSRILLFTPPFSNGMSANGVIGQPNLTTVGATTSPSTASGLANPIGLFFK